jgi:hypothetical protein
MKIIDRFEGDFAVIEDGETFVSVDRRLVCEAACEGDVVELYDGRYITDAKATAERREAFAARLKRFG